MKKFDFNLFVQEQFEQFKGTFSLKEVENLLYIGEEAYTKDNPNSTGKTLVLDFLAFKGKKDDESIIDYSVELKKGLTLWITKNSNFKGKSSIFKIIKFALTGDNSIKPDVNKWIEEIFLCFTIGVHQYTIHIINKWGLVARLYNVKLNDWGQLENVEKKPIFETNSKDDFKNEIQDFFFNQFSYYSLKWTQGSSKKDNLDLVESSASWKTYFKSICLESKDYGVLFFGGNIEKHQGQKIFQTLMGLDFTFAINQLTIRRDNLLNEKAKAKLKIQNTQGDNLKKIERLKKQISKVNLQIEALNKAPIVNSNQELVSLEKEYKLLISQYEQSNKVENEYREFQKTKEISETKLEQKRKTFRTIRNRIDSVNKKILDLNQHIEIGIFLSDLEIKNCPSCHHDVNETKKTTNLNAHKCPLCSETINDSDGDDKESYEKKIKELQVELKQAEQQKNIIEKEGGEIKNQLRVLKVSMREKERSLQKVNTNTLLLQIQSAQSKINKILAQNPVNNPQREEVIAKKAVFEYQLKEIEKNSSQTKPSNNFEEKTKFLEKVIKALINKRYEMGVNTIKRLQDLMLKEVQSFGITSITSIRITEKFDIKYTQWGEEISFEKISEGEQLRAKLAFYLSLIQLDIEYNMGKHTRFLMIDSPGREEAGKKYMEGLIQVLQGIENRYQDKLQILIATADSRFENVLKNQFVYPEETYIF
ncbi:hypothetical protein ACFO3O_12790 [Dokdonia ponticola]|uniref:Uncharacterized protein n=1 Tax=Dokdonia ponticola TaxID=2041041 RepID=A0ABV9HZ55_9FLAO